MKKFRTNQGVGQHLTDEQVAALMLLIDPDVTSMTIATEFSANPILLLTKEGASFEGVLTGVRDGYVEMRQGDGKQIHVLKSAVAAVRRP